RICAVPLNPLLTAVSVIVPAPTLPSVLAPDPLKTPSNVVDELLLPANSVPPPNSTVPTPVSEPTISVFALTSSVEFTNTDTALLFGMTFELPSCRTDVPPPGLPIVVEPA